MKAKEKAKQIFDSFENDCYWIENNGKPCIESKKSCALICVDYLIDEQTMWQNGEVNPVLYWQEVKKEIEKL